MGADASEGEEERSAAQWGAAEWRAFPPLYTLQPVESTRAQQLRVWVDLVHDWAARSGQWRFLARECPVFANAAIRRRLPPDGVAAVEAALLQDGRAERAGDRVQLYQRRPADLARELWDWVSANDMLDGVYTVFELHADQGPCRGLDAALVRKALSVLERDGRAEVFTGSTTDDEGVKFLSARR